ncbi:hypothetical protein CAOG_03919 [Capsaspora owczarzaki ATCC 30864]|uniref:Ubiquitin-like protein ATG12 n=1 Tax=Capsaspora owczarzaki (strain ATCC 30864) TaxID=595528 RepID=A0A0D2UDG3_CAPO3|nr:hypothetical protein CAOG_03919 [Capsaspora owczarzaki ATCC 30864]KJE93076.1 hypothetical protein CAOG_003919 [Capsaspora owczarzaki ATCC 30864]|eukprot:XP_004363647.1 hypothetical protein CAOG_03919 [Capsaspora owczarzaki ATCC 30864]
MADDDADFPSSTTNAGPAAAGATSSSSSSSAAAAAAANPNAAAGADDDNAGAAPSAPSPWTLRKPPTKDKVIVQFRAAGNAPLMRQKKFKITASEKFQTVIEFLRKQLKFKPTDPLFLYINQAFSPAPDEIVRNLYQCFEIKGQLDIQYATTPAWG